MSGLFRAQYLSGPPRLSVLPARSSHGRHAHATHAPSVVRPAARVKLSFWRLGIQAGAGMEVVDQARPGQGLGVPVGLSGACRGWPGAFSCLLGAPRHRLFRQGKATQRVVGTRTRTRTVGKVGKMGKGREVSSYGAQVGQGGCDAGQGEQVGDRRHASCYSTNLHPTRAARHNHCADKTSKHY